MNEIDHNNQEKLTFWSRRLTYPVINALDSNFQRLLSGEFVSKINPEAYRVPKEACGLLFCSDERLNNLNLDDIFANQRFDKPIFPIRLPGAVVGQDIDKLKEKLEDYSFYKLAAVSHADCGAAALDLKQKGLEGNVDQHAKDLISALEGIEDWGFIDTDKDPELKLIHPASCLLVDGTGRRNYQSDDVLPKECFILNRSVYGDDELAKSQITVLTAIALGDHGLGSSFSAKHPFYIFVSALNDQNLRKYMEEAEGVAINFSEDLVKVVGFLAPKVD